MNITVKLQYLVIYVLALCYFILIGFDILDPTGRVGATRKNGEGCICHGFLPVDSVDVWIAGPGRVLAGSQSGYTLFMTGGPAVAGGFNVAVWSGSISPVDSTTHLLPSVDGLELTHTMPKPFQNDTVRWDFSYQAPSTQGTDTLYSVGNSVNGDGLPTGDAFNFGVNFIVEVYKDTMLDVTEEVQPYTFQLFQNYPNPFNPVTDIRLRITDYSYVVLKVFDVLGRVVMTLVNEKKAPGEYVVRWDARGMPSGIYLYRLRVGSFIETKKMVLVQ
ncbi:MAG: T9SS type A sorting domain-containing protein [Ignavibacteriae bacterium]|nr:T9SS type A sorting domain-containing protein [Ignavibacteriota bacterium]